MSSVPNHMGPMSALTVTLDVNSPYVYFVLILTRWCGLSCFRRKVPVGRHKCPQGYVTQICQSLSTVLPTVNKHNCGILLIFT